MLVAVAYFLPQFHLIGVDTKGEGWVFPWSGSPYAGASVSVGLRSAVFLCWLATLSFFFWALRTYFTSPKAVGKIHWATFFLLLFILLDAALAEDVLTDLKSSLTRVESHAHAGSLIAFFVMIYWEFVAAGRAKKQWKASPQPTGVS
ncbi:MAG: hypothetical protein ACUVRD_05470 [Bacteroidia bacterium]